MTLTNFLSRPTMARSSREVRIVVGGVSVEHGKQDEIRLADKHAPSAAASTAAFLFDLSTAGTLSRIYFAATLLRRMSSMRFMPLCQAINDAIDTSPGSGDRHFEMTSFVPKDLSRAKRREIFPSLVKDGDVVAIISDDGQAWLRGTKEERMRLAYALLKKMQPQRIHTYSEVHDTALDAFRYLDSLDITESL
jgi:hypothetical protein